MLRLEILSEELYDEVKEEFIQLKGTTIQLEHSLVSVSKWEAKWNKPFLTDTRKTTEEFIDYIKCMTITQNVDDEIHNRLTLENINRIKEYINAPMTATTINDNGSNRKRRGEVLTSELIYYSMLYYNIPFECQKWHLNRLLMLIRVCDIKNNPPKKMSMGNTMRRNAALNAARRKQFNSRG